MGKSRAEKDVEKAAIPERKRRRLEKKMKKAEAFLALAASNDATKKKAVSDSDSDEDSSKAKPKNAPIPDLTNAQTSMTEDEIRAAIDKRRKEIIARQKKAMQRPKLFLTLENLTSGLDPADQERRPLYAMDVQRLLLYTVQGQYASYKPAWCKMLRIGKLSRTCVVVLDHVTSQDYTQHPTCFNTLRTIVPEVVVEFTPPMRHDGSLVRELLTVPLSPNQIAARNLLQVKRARAQLKNNGKPKSQITSDGSSGEMAEAQAAGQPMEKTFLLLSTEQMIQEGYPVPTVGSQFDGFVYTQTEYAEVTDQSPIFAVDCEMCQTASNRSELTRVSVINEEGECVYDSFVKPRNKITNYLTKFSGITAELLDPVKTRIEDVHADLRDLLPADAILAGQSLCFDLKALKMFHPYVIDTSVIYNLSGIRGSKTSLKTLSQIFLGKAIQKSKTKGHCSVEDATATMELVKLKLRNGLEFGDMSLGRSVLHRQVEEASRARAQQSTDPATCRENGLKRSSPDYSDTASESKKVKTDKKSDSKKSKIEVTESHATSQECSERLKSGQSSVISKAKPEVENSAEENERRAVFLNNRAKFTEDFFQLLAETGKTMSVVDDSTLLDQHPSDWLEANLVPAVKVKARTDNVCSEVKVKDFTWVRYSGEAENKEKRLSKLDRELSRIVEALPACSLLMVLLSGSQQHDAMALVHIT